MNAAMVIGQLCQVLVERDPQRPTSAAQHRTHALAATPSRAAARPGCESSAINSGTRSCCCSPDARHLFVPGAGRPEKHLGSLCVVEFTEYSRRPGSL